jgi:hypothetical protein
MDPQAPKKCTYYFHANNKIVSNLPCHGWAKISSSVTLCVYHQGSLNMMWLITREDIDAFSMKASNRTSAYTPFLYTLVCGDMLLHAIFPFGGLPFLLKHFHIPIMCNFLLGVWWGDCEVMQWHVVWHAFGRHCDDHEASGNVSACST